MTSDEKKVALFVARGGKTQAMLDELRKVVRGEPQPGELRGLKPDTIILDDLRDHEAKIEAGLREVEDRIRSFSPMQVLVAATGDERTKKERQLDKLHGAMQLLMEIGNEEPKDATNAVTTRLLRAITPLRQLEALLVRGIEIETLEQHVAGQMMKNPESKP